MPTSTPRRRLATLTPVPWTSVALTGGFWAPRVETNRTVTIPHEFDLLEKNGVLQAYDWDWWTDAKTNPPWRIIVGDLAKWIEAASYTFATHPDARLAARIDRATRAMVAGQKPDGYLHPNPLRRGQPWTNLQEYHELYEIGHDIEAAVAHHSATGQPHLIDALCRTADLVAATFGRGPGQKRGYCGHPEIELALAKLYRATGRRRYLDLAGYFVDERGRRPSYFEREAAALTKAGVRTFNWYKNAKAYWYCQAHQPLRQQQEAAGHAVRALYLYSGAADVAAETGDRELLGTCRRLWKSITEKRMYVIGGVGSTATGESFSFDYDLPNETGYAETCANIALVLFAHRMLQIEADSRYADVMERALYNGVLSGVSLDGRHFFYANHLAYHPRAAEGAPDHVAGTRREWFGCACCPPNIARLLASLGQYLYSVSKDGLYVHLYASGKVGTQVAGRAVTLRQETQYPWGETVNLTLGLDAPTRLALHLRIPGWCRAARLTLNGKPVRLAPITRRGYARIARTWNNGDRIRLTLPMPIERVEAHPRVRMNCGKVALQRGPVVYCLEEIDNGPGLTDLFIPRAAKLRSRLRPDLLGGCVVIEGRAQRAPGGWDGSLYRADPSATRAANIVAVPYCLWANRKPGEMVVWVRGN